MVSSARPPRSRPGDGLSREGRGTRTAVACPSRAGPNARQRLRAAEWFAQDMPVRETRVSANSVYVWRRRWRAAGEAGLASAGPGGSSCRLDDRRQGASYLLHRMGFSPRSRRTARSSATRTRAPPGVGRRGRRENGSGGAGRVAVFRGRGRPDPASAEGPHVGTARADPDCGGVGQGIRPGLGRRAGVRTARPARPVDLPHPAPPRPQG